MGCQTSKRYESAADDIESSTGVCSMRTMKRLNRVNRRTIIVNALFALATHKDYRASPLWVLIRDLCGVGCTSANEIARECGWEPNRLCRDYEYRDLVSVRP